MIDRRGELEGVVETRRSLIDLVGRGGLRHVE